MSQNFSLMILGDICPTDDTRELFDRGAINRLFGSLVENIANSNLSIANLECVLTNSALGIRKVGPVLVGKPEDAVTLAAAGFDLLGLANNHIGDCGGPGVFDTIKACTAAELDFTGAGLNVDQARRPTIVEREGWRIGVVAVAEHEFNAAGPDIPGAHIFDPLQVLTQIAELKLKTDFLVVLYHGGIEHYPYPSPLLRSKCRALIDSGANLVLCQHSHCIGTRESYAAGEILYGQGNALYGYRSGNPAWNEGLAVSVRLRKLDGRVKTEIDYLPIGCESGGNVDLLPEYESKQCLAGLASRSEQATDEVWLNTSWLNFCDRLGQTHLPHLLGMGRLLTRMNRVLGGTLTQTLFTHRQRMVSMNVLRCDAHREVILTNLERSLSASTEERRAK